MSRFNPYYFAKAKGGDKPRTRTCNWCSGTGKLNKKVCSLCEGKGTFPPFTQEERVQFMQACRQTFNAIASDIAPGDDPEYVERMPLAHVVEVALDADYMDMYGVPNGLKPEERKRFKLRMRQLRYSDLAKRLAREALR